jgi:hypothetical protein
MTSFFSICPFFDCWCDCSAVWGTLSTQHGSVDKMFDALRGMQSGKGLYEAPSNTSNTHYNSYQAVTYINANTREFEQAAVQLKRHLDRNKNVTAAQFV